MSYLYHIKFKHIMKTDFKILVRPFLENSNPLCKIGRLSDHSHPMKLFQPYVLLARSAFETLSSS